MREICEYLQLAWTCVDLQILLGIFWKSACSSGFANFHWLVLICDSVSRGKFLSCVSFGHPLARTLDGLRWLWSRCNSYVSLRKFPPFYHQCKSTQICRTSSDMLENLMPLATCVNLTVAWGTGWMGCLRKFLKFNYLKSFRHYRWEISLSLFKVVNFKRLSTNPHFGWSEAV